MWSWCSHNIKIFIFLMLSSNFYAFCLPGTLWSDEGSQGRWIWGRTCQFQSICQVIMPLFPCLFIYYPMTFICWKLTLTSVCPCQLLRDLQWESAGLAALGEQKWESGPQSQRTSQGWSICWRSVAKYGSHYAWTWISFLGIWSANFLEFLCTKTAHFWHLRTEIKIWCMQGMMISPKMNISVMHCRWLTI